MPSNEGFWHVWVDTGGTFTDCIAVSPDGATRRAKVLSTASLRGTIVRQLDREVLSVTGEWLEHHRLIEGFRFRLLGTDRGEATAVARTLDPETGTLYLDRAVGPLHGRPAFELLSPEEAPIMGARMALGLGSADPLPPIRMRLATTRGTNALLERKGSPMALFVTRGFRDLLAIGNQQRPDLFSLRIERPLPLPFTISEVTERIGADGSVLAPLDEAEVRREAQRVLASGVSIAAVALINSYLDPRHERRVADILLEAGFEHVTCSSAISPAIHYLHRSETACANAYLAPLFDDYLREISRTLDEDGSAAQLRVMTSAGGLASPAAYHPKDSLLSGPAAGIVGAAAAGASAGHDRIISFDMGGTSTDVARFDGELDYTWEHEVGGVRLLSPALAIETVAAGGGSVCGIVADGMAVGPESAGASPGPASYGEGGPLTLTDCSLLLGRLSGERFGIPVSPAAAHNAAVSIADVVAKLHGSRSPIEPLLEGFIEIANEMMADAIRGVSVRKGYDPAEYAIVSFGGAGGQHVCGIAGRLGVETIIVPPDAALLSARGLGAAAVERVAERQLLQPLGDERWLGEVVADAAAEAEESLAAEAGPADAIETRCVFDVRLRGQNTTISIEGPIPDLPRRFRERYRDIYGFSPAESELEIESLRVIGRLQHEAPDLSPPRLREAPETERRSWIDGRWLSVRVLDRTAPALGSELAGPLFIDDPYTTLFVAPGWSATALPDGAIRLRAAEGPPSRATTETPEAVREQLFASRFETIVRETGDQLERTAVSVNVKERLDFSCALLDPEGELVANAPHIPVHLGSMGVCVRAVADTLHLAEGDVVITNHPAFGGSHLPDITVVTPVYDAAGARLGFVASRAHHAEIGGTRPGSMPPDATTLEEEGVVISPMYLVRGGEARWDEIEGVLRGARHPSRAPDQNLADLRAQVAANHRGGGLLRGLCEEHGLATVQRYMRALTNRCERLCRGALDSLGPGTHSAVEHLDDGSAVAVRIDIAGGRARFDFAGTSAVHPGNLNATPAIVRSAVLYVLRLLIDEPVPLNEGLLRPVEIVIPPSLLSPDFTLSPGTDPAVVGGNTEVSQRLVDTLLKALGLCACSQGTMNNLLWGTDEFGFYETIGGGAGAGPGFDGASGVHTHMTNTRITDAEVMEHRYPVRVTRFELRRESGGAGRWRGGDGLVREIEFLAPMQVSLLAQHRVEGPYGMAGGDPGRTGSQKVIQTAGEVVDLSGNDRFDVEPGDRLVVETPGGGGWGR